jgi:hypothetical protein
VRDREGDGAAIDGPEQRSDEPVQRRLERSSDVALGYNQGRDDGSETLRQSKRLGEGEGGEARDRHAQGLHQLGSITGKPM